MVQTTLLRRLPYLLLPMIWLGGQPHRAASVELAVNGERRVQFSESWFDQTCFGQLTEAMARRRCQELLHDRIRLADVIVGLSKDQRLKLQLAGSADIHRFFVTYAAFKRQFEFGDLPASQWRKEPVWFVNKQSPMSRKSLTD